MNIPVVSTNRSSSNGRMAVGTMVGQFTHEGFVEEQAWDTLVSEMHAKIWSVTDRHNGVLGRVKRHINSLIDVIPQSVKINELFQTMSARGMAVQGISQRNKEIIRVTWNLVIFPKMSFI